MRYAEYSTVCQTRQADQRVPPNPSQASVVKRADGCAAGRAISHYRRMISCRGCSSAICRLRSCREAQQEENSPTTADAECQGLQGHWQLLEERPVNSNRVIF